MLLDPIIEKVKILKARTLRLMVFIQRQIVCRNSTFAQFEEGFLIANQLQDRTRELEGIAADVTREKERIAQLIQGLPGLVIVFDNQFQVTDHYQGRARSKADEIADLDIRGIFQRHKHLEIKQATEQLTDDSMAIYFDFTDGRGASERAFRCSVSSVSPTQFVLYIQDDTERVHKDRLIQVQKAQIAQASKLASLGEMAGNIAHEVNTPLGTIFLLAGQIEKYLQMHEVDFDQVLTMAHKIQRTVMRISSTVKSLKLISRDGSNDPFENCCISDLFDDALDLCREKLHMACIELRLDIPAGLGVKVRRVQLTQVILNILSNAIYVAKSHPEEKWISIKVHDEGSMVRIQVTDCGRGIPEDVLERIFDPFFTTKSIGEGTGLGMVISQRILRDHSSQLAYELNQGHTSFYFQLAKVTDFAACA